MARAIHTSKTTATHCVTLFLNHWIAGYGVPDHLPTNNDSQFVSTFFVTLCLLLGLKHLAKTVYYPQRNGYVKKYNNRIDARLPHQVAGHHVNWDILC